MPSRELKVIVTSDTRQMQTGLKQADHALDSTGKRAGRMSGAMKTAAAVGVGALAVGLKGVTAAAIESEKSQVKMQAQLKASGVSYRAHAKQINEVIQKHSQLSGLDDEDLQDSFTNIVRVTGDVNKSLKLNALAMDFARAKHMDVAKAGEIVAKVAGGNTGILSRYGLQIDKGASSTEALGLLQRKFAGQAEAYGKTTAGAGDRAAVAWENLKEKLGTALLPALAKAGNALAKVLNWMDKNETATKILVGTVGAFVAALGTVMIATKVAVALRTLRSAVIAVNVAMRANPIGLVITALAALAVGLTIAYKRSETFKKVVDGVFRWVRNAAVDSIDFILAGVQKFLSAIGSMIGVAGKLPGIGNKFKGLAEKVKNASSDVGDLRTQLDGLHSKNIKVGVKLDFDAPKLVGKNPFAKGDGIGRSIGIAAQAFANSAPMSAFPGGSSGLDGADADLAPFANVGSRFGLSVSSGLRPGSVTSSGNTSYHASGDAIDEAGSPSGMMGYFNFMKSNFGGRLRELIYTPGGVGIKDGKPFRYTGQVAADHFDHVHVAYTGPFGDGPGKGDGIGSNPKARRVFNYFRRHGFTPEQAAGWVGNISQESGFDAGIVQPGGEGHGLVQWGGSRFTALQNYAGKRRRPWTDFQTQLDFVMHELRGPESSAFGAIRSARSVGAATSAIASRYERAGIIGDRSGPAMEAYKAFSGGKRGSPASSHDSASMGSGGLIPNAGRMRRGRIIPNAGFISGGRVGPRAAAIARGGLGVPAVIDGEDPAAVAAAALAAATAEHTAAIATLATEMKRSNDIADATGTSELAQMKKYLADVASSVVGARTVSRNYTPGMGVAYAY